MSIRRITIRGALTLSFLLVATVAILVLSGHRYYWLSTQLEREERSDDLELARVVTQSLNRYVVHRRELVRRLAAEISAREMQDSARLDALVDTARSREIALNTLGIVDRRGTSLAFSPRVDESGAPNTGRGFGDRQWFLDAQRPEAERSVDVVISRISQRPAIAVSAPIHSSTGEFLGAVVAGLNLDLLRASLRDVDAAQHDRLVVTDRRGRVIVHTSAQWEAEARDLSREAVFQAALRSGEGTATYQSQFTGTERAAVFARVPAAGWVVWVSRGPEHRTARVRSLLVSLLYSGIVSLAAAGAAATVLSHRLARPLRELAADTRRIAEGGLAHVERQRETTIREVADLYAGFRTMAESLQVQYGALEAKVTERTHALEEAARVAEVTSTQLRAQDEIRRGYAELAALLNSLDRSHILNEGVRKIAASLRSPLAAVYLTENGAASLRLKTHWALDDAALDMDLLGPAGLPSRVAVERRPVVLVEPFGGQGIRLRVGLGELQAAAIAAYPLESRERLLGVIAVALLEPLNDDTRSFLENSARQLSVALTNAGLFEAVRYQSQRLEELNSALNRASQAKSQFLSSMSHELRTPLNGIIGFTDVLLMSGRDPLTGRQRTALEKVAGSGRHLLGLINQVLDLSKIEAGRLEVQPTTFALAPLVAECLATVEPQAQKKGLALGATGVETVGELVQDREKIKQVLVNLLSNAVKFTESGGIELRAAQHGEAHVVLAVADTGPGIASEHQAAIFEEFRQLGGDAASQGTGLGLAISRRLANLLGGTLTVQSTSGHGSVFTLRVPRRWAARDQYYVTPDGADVTGPRILVIEDDQNAVDIIRAAVADQAITVEWAPSARQGLERARTTRPHGIVLDVMLQDGEDGWQVLERLKGDPATRTIPVVLHSVIDNPDRARVLGAEDVLAKPATPAAIAAMLSRLLGRAERVPETPA